MNKIEHIHSRIISTRSVAAIVPGVPALPLLTSNTSSFAGAEGAGISTPGPATCMKSVALM